MHLLQKLVQIKLLELGIDFLEKKKTMLEIGAIFHRHVWKPNSQKISDIKFAVSMLVTSFLMGAHFNKKNLQIFGT